MIPPLTKQYYSIGEVSKMLDIPIHTLWFWERNIPMFKPNRTPKGTRRFTQEDVRMTEYIKDLVWGKGLKIEKAAVYMNRNYSAQSPQLHKCDTPQDAITLLDELKMTLDNAHSIAKIDAVIKFLTNGGCEDQA